MARTPKIVEDRKEQIIDAAMAVFARLGFHEARMDDIAQEAGLSKAALYLYYKSKDAIIAQGLGFSAINKRHLLLLILPLVTAGITTFYMFRMWFLTFTGEPKDHHVHDHAQGIGTDELAAFAFRRALNIRFPARNHVGFAAIEGLHSVGY